MTNDAAPTDECTRLPLAAQPVMPWANGGGSTRQVAIEPPDGALSRGFDWRVSCAQITGDGPFSSLPGIDRSLWLLRGNGLRLVIDGREVALACMQRCDFRGEDPATARLVDGPCEDLNVMSSRARVRVTAHIEQLRAGQPLNVPAAPQWLVLVLDGELRRPATAQVLRAGDAVRDRGGASAPTFVCALAGNFLITGFHRREAGSA